MRTIIATLAVLLTSLAANGQEIAGPLRHLPENTMVAAQVRVEALGKSAFGRAVLDTLQKDKEFKELFKSIDEEFGIRFSDVESLTIFLLDLELTGDKSGPLFRSNRWQPERSPPTRGRAESLEKREFVSYTEAEAGDDFAPLLLITMRKPINRKLLMKKKAERSGQDFGLQFVSDHSFVIGTDAAVIRFVASTTAKESELARILSQEANAPIIQAGYRLTPQLKAALLSDRQNFAGLSMIFPLLNANHASVAIEPEEVSKIHLRLQAANERQANLAAQAFKTLLALGEVDSEASLKRLEDGKAGLEPQARQRAEDEIALNRALLKMASGGSIEHRQADVNVSLQLAAQPQHIVSMLQGLLRMRSSTRATLIAY